MKVSLPVFDTQMDKYNPFCQVHAPAHKPGQRFVFNKTIHFEVSIQNDCQANEPPQFTLDNGPLLCICAQ